MRKLTLQPNSLQPVALYRRQGRPRLSWQSVLYAHVRTTMSTDQLNSLLLCQGRSFVSGSSILQSRLLTSFVASAVVSPLLLLLVAARASDLQVSFRQFHACFYDQA